MGILRAAENAMAQVIAAITIGRWVYVSELPCYSQRKDTTRARANALREYLTHSDKENKFNHQELYEVFDLCELQSVCERMSL
jgi:hypothetical protein